MLFVHAPGLGDLLLSLRGMFLAVPVLIACTSIVATRRLPMRVAVDEGAESEYER